MTDVSEVADGTYLIETDESHTRGRAGMSRCTLIYFIADRETALIEVGSALVVPAVVDAIRRLGHDPSRLSYLILTHIHLDHGGGAGQLAQQFPHLQVLVHERGARHLVEPSRLIEGSRQAYGATMDEEYGPVVPIAERQVRAVGDGEVIPLGDRELKIVYAPGHAPHQMAIYDTKSQGLFCGEALGLSLTGNDIVSPGVGFDLDDALATIDKLSKLEVKLMFFSHGGVGGEAAEVMQSVRANTKAYGDIILAGIKAGEGKEEISRRLGAYQKESAQRERRFDDTIRWYVAHFQKKGVI